MLPGKLAGQHFLSVAEVSGLRNKQCVYIICILVLRRPETSATVRI